MKFQDIFKDDFWLSMLVTSERGMRTTTTTTALLLKMTVSEYDMVLKIKWCKYNKWHC